MKNNKGFTFVELLVVIALLSIVLILTISQVQRVNNNSKIKLCKNKLSLIEESLNLYLDNNRDLFSNSGLCEEEPVSNSCYTSVLKIAEQGIIDYDKDKNIINPVNNKILNDYKVKIIYDSSNDKFSSEIQKENETVSDKNYDTICGKSTGIKEEDNDKSIFDKKSYGFNVIKIEEDGSEVVINFNAVEKAPNEIGNYCKDLNFDRKDEYSYVNYEIENDTTVNCRYKKGIRYSLSIIKANGIVIDNIDNYINKKYKLNESVTIKFRIEGNYLYDFFSCNVSDSCEYNPNDSTIKVTFKNEEDIVLTINSKDMLNVKMFYENPDTDFYDYDSSGDKLVLTDVDAENYCKSNVRNNYEYFRYDSSDNSCYYKLKRTNLSFDLSDTNIVSILVNPGSKTMSATTSTINDNYKYGQKITLKVNYKNGYEYDSIVCISGECTLNDNGTITLVSYADSVSIAPKSKKTPPKYMVYHHYQDVDDFNGYSSILISNIDPVNASITESNLLATYCDATVGIYKYVSTISFYNSSNYEINCYYDRSESVLVEFDATLNNVNTNSGLSNFVLKLTPNNSRDASTSIIDLTSSTSRSRTYRYGQEIVLTISGYADVPNKEPVTCNSNNECIINANGTFKTTLNNKITFKPGKVEYKVYNHYQDADDINGYTVNSVKTNEIVLSVGDDTNYNNVCNKSKDGFTYNKTISYLDRSKREINCYYDRSESVLVEFDATLNNVNTNSGLSNFVLTLTPNNSRDVSTSIIDLTSSTSRSRTYKYGQEIVLTISGYADVPNKEPVTCNSNNECIINANGTFKTTLNNKITFKPGKVEYKVYNHYQDADDINGYTVDSVKTNEIVLSVGDDTNYNNVCNQSKDGFTYNKTISYLDRSKREINCYYDRSESVLVKFDATLNNINTNSGLSNFVLKLTPNNSRDVSTSIIDLTSSTSRSRTYKYGQEIVLTISGYADVPNKEPVTCNSNNECIINANGTFKTALNNKITFKPGKVEYKVYNHYQDADDINGYTADFVKTIEIVLSVGDDTNYNNVCNQSKDGFTYNKTISYLDRGKREINCYYDRN